MHWYYYLIIALVAAAVGYIGYRFELASIETTAKHEASHLKDVAQKAADKAEAELRNRL